MKVEQRFLYNLIKEQRDKAENRAKQKMYQKQMNNIEAGLCPYGCINYKKQMEDDRDNFIK